MRLRRYGSFAGGIDLPDDKRATLDLSIAPWPEWHGREDQDSTGETPVPLSPAVIRVPLAPCGGKGATPVVRVGEDVTTGERIAVAGGDARAVDVFAPLAGRVTAFVTAPVAGRDGFVDSPAIELADLSPPGGIAELDPTFDWRAADTQTLVKRISEGGLTTHRRPPTPLSRWVRDARGSTCRILIANVMENQPFVTADHRLLAEHGTDVIRGLAILARCIGAEDVFLAVDRRRTDYYRRLVGPARMYGIERVALPHKYPTGADELLVKVLTGLERLPGRDTMSVGVAVIDAATCFATYRWVACGCPPTARVVTVNGPTAGNRGNFWIPFGADCLSLLDGTAARAVHGGPMTGLRPPEDAVAGPATDAILALEPETPPPATPCIRCGWCTDHCPARLNVSALNDMYELGDLEGARRAGAEACIECGVCSYVCPARLPLSQRVRQLKRTIAEQRTHMPLFEKQGVGSRA